MPEIDTWQIPAADDISPDALEYLFCPQKRTGDEPPWVRVSIEPEAPEPPPGSQSSLVRRIEFLSQRLQEVSAQLQGATYQVGYLKGRLAEKDEQLKQLPDYRLRAARALISEREVEGLRLQCKEMEDELEHLRSLPWSRLARACQELSRPSGISRVYMPIIPWVMLAMFWFVVAGTIIGLREHWWY